MQNAGWNYTSIYDGFNGSALVAAQHAAPPPWIQAVCVHATFNQHRFSKFRRALDPVRKRDPRSDGPARLEFDHLHAGANGFSQRCYSRSNQAPQVRLDAAYHHDQGRVNTAAGALTRRAEVDGEYGAQV